MEASRSAWSSGWNLDAFVGFSALSYFSSALLTRWGGVSIYGSTARSGWLPTSLIRGRAWNTLKGSIERRAIDGRRNEGIIMN
jgi:hypothetical protein